MRSLSPMLALLLGFPAALAAQSAPAHPTMTMSDSMQMSGMADHAMDGSMDMNMMKHMYLSPVRTPTRADSVRAMKVAMELKRAIAKYQDTAAAVADGYRMFAPGVKNQRVYHFTNYRHAFGAAFRFDPAKPTSILYTRDAQGTFHLVGAMYTMPKRVSLDKLNERVPLSIARWHRHVNWCVPKKGEARRFTERKNGAPLFGPESPIATKQACEDVGGRFLADPLGWMVHANVFEGDDLGTIWGDTEHGHMHMQ